MLKRVFMAAVAAAIGSAAGLNPAPEDVKATSEQIVFVIPNDGNHECPGTSGGRYIKSVVAGRTGGDVLINYTSAYYYCSAYPSISATSSTQYDPTKHAVLVTTGSVFPGMAIFPDDSLPANGSVFDTVPTLNDSCTANQSGTTYTFVSGGAGTYKFCIYN